jgi:hypothetical protein
MIKNFKALLDDSIFEMKGSHSKILWSFDSWRERPMRKTVV